MPGIIGINKSVHNLNSVHLRAARDLLVYKDWYKKDTLFEDNQILCTRTHLGINGDLQSPTIVENIHCWVEGSFYNIAEIQQHFSLSANGSANILIEAFQKKILDQVLGKIDGYFTAVIYEKSKSRLFLITDRLGLKPLYCWDDGKNLAWSSELKGFLAFPPFQPNIQKNAIDCFLDLGYLLGDLTWFKDVRLINASTILEFDLKASKLVKEKCYWTWGKIKSLKISEAEAVENLANLIKAAVQKRNSNAKIVKGLSLSGGLDSRAILACLAQTEDSIATYTYGKKGCQDIQISKQLNELKKGDHFIFEMDENNWLEKRLEAVWKADGLGSMMHLHFSTFQQKIKSFCDLNWNGFLGEVALGGALIKRKDQGIRETIEKQPNILEKYFGKHAYLLNPKDSFFDIEKEDPFWIDVRSRRMVNVGSIEFGKVVEQLKPLADNDLLEFIFSLPDKLRMHSSLYIKALMKIERTFFENIPWQRTGLAPANLKQTKFIKRFKIRQIQDRLGWESDRHFSDYPNWIRTAKGKAFFGNLLQRKNAVYANFIEEDFEEKLLAPHLSGKRNYTEKIGRAATLEYWLRKVFSKKL